jgi:probable rRNA maturation factor
LNNINKCKTEPLLFITNFGSLKFIELQPKVFFHYLDKASFSVNKLFLKQFICQLFSAEGRALNRIDYIFCSDDYLLNINQNFLKHSYYTDIITFDLSESPKVIRGEIYISVERVRENSIVYATSKTNEMLRVIFHGALHLCSVKDKTKTQRRFMRLREDYYLRLFKEFVSRETLPSASNGLSKF